MSATETYLTLRDVGQRLKIGRTSVWKLIAEGGLRRMKVGKIVRVKESDFLAWCEKHMTAEGGKQ